MLDSETMEYSIDIIVENVCDFPFVSDNVYSSHEPHKVINLKQILRDLKGPTSAAQDLVEIQNRRSLDFVH